MPRRSRARIAKPGSPTCARSRSPTASFASVLSVQSIEHVPDPERVLAEVRAGARAATASAIFVTPNRLTFARADEIIDPYHYVEYVAERARARCAKAAFDEVELRGLFGSSRYLRTGGRRAQPPGPVASQATRCGCVALVPRTRPPAPLRHACSRAPRAPAGRRRGDRARRSSSLRSEDRSSEALDLIAVCRSGARLDAPRGGYRAARSPRRCVFAGAALLRRRRAARLALGPDLLARRVGLFILDRRGFERSTSTSTPSSSSCWHSRSAIYKLIVAIFGIESRGADFQMRRSGPVHHQPSALLFVYIRRRRVDEWLALAARCRSSSSAPLGTTCCSRSRSASSARLACGIGALLALDREDRRGDVIATVLLTDRALLFSGTSASRSWSGA